MIFGSAAGGLSDLAVKMGERRRKVLIADDDPSIRMLYRHRLEEAGYRVLEAADGTAAWNCIRDERPSVVVLDMKMPGAYGLEVMNRMTEEKVLLPVVICTAYDHMQEEFVVATYPHFRYLVKPVDPERMLEAIRELTEAA